MSSFVQKNKRKENIRKNIPLVLMALPCMLWLLAFHFFPMFGLVMAFEDFTYRDGIFGSTFIGWENFKYIFGSGEIIRTLWNTIAYHFAFTLAITVSGILIGVLLYYIHNRRAQRIFQKAIIMPYMISYTVLAYIVFILLSNDSGLINQLLQMFGADRISWYTEPRYWPVILLIVNTWFGAGIKSVYYYASLMAVDESLFEAARLDGAKKYHEIFNIMLPSIMPTICIFLILDLGGILNTNFALFYSVPMDSSALYSVTDVLSTYTYRGLFGGDIGTTTALGLFTGVVTTCMTLLVNGIVKKISPENSLL